MAKLSNKLITRQMQWQANMTEQNHLGAALIARPAKLSGVMDTLFSAKHLYSENPLSSLLMGSSLTEETIGSTSWDWELKGANCRPLIVVENVLPATVTKPGEFHRTFKIKLDENWYLPGDVIHPGTSDKRYQCRIQKDAVRHGEGWLYDIQLMTDDSTLFLPVKHLERGAQWGKLYSQYEEAAGQAGSTQFSLPLSLSNRLSKIRKMYSVTDYASTEVLAIGIPDSKGKIHNSWMRYADVEYWKQYYRERERLLFYSRSTDTVIGGNGRPVRSGAGVQQQLEDSNVARYSRLTASFIEEYLMDVHYGRVSPGSGRAVAGFTGEYGMLQFHRAIQDWTERKGFVQNVEVFVKGAKSTLHVNALQAGHQYVKYNMANGSSLELYHMPLYDDREINWEIDPITGFPFESQRITFLDLSGEGGKSNIKIIKKKEGYAFGYVQGLYGPYGPSKGGTMAHSGSYYEMYVEENLGSHIHDITKCGELILSRV